MVRFEGIWYNWLWKFENDLIDVIDFFNFFIIDIFLKLLIDPCDPYGQWKF